MIGIIDYGLGNVRALANVYERLGLDATAVATGDSLADPDRLILPGVGSFDQAMTQLNNSGMRQALDSAVLAQAKPILGICVGMQMMSRGSSEGSQAGLGWIPGEVGLLETQALDSDPRLPHIGWNTVRIRDEEGIFASLPASPRFYFLHSYGFRPDSRDVILAETTYGDTFVSSVRERNIYGVQFHPEKSHQWGIALLSNFARV